MKASTGPVRMLLRQLGSLLRLLIAQPLRFILKRRRVPRLTSLSLGSASVVFLWAEE
jgi:hypothetical protein